MKLKLPASELVNPQFDFNVFDAGDGVVLLAKLSREQFEDVCTVKADLEDLEDDGQTEAEETSDGYSA